jgi:GNAT superfamily N-acetyltransferase
VKIAESEPEIMECFEVLQELRPRLQRDSFYESVRAMQGEGYVLGFLEKGGEVVSVAGFRICQNFAAEGKAMYIYDLVTRHPCRSEGWGADLMDDLERYAADAGCVIVHLDSGTFRYGAHKFYFNRAYQIRAYHFLKRLSDTESAFDKQASG